MNQKQKTFYDLVPTTLTEAVLIRFRSRKAAEKWLTDHKAHDMWVIIPTTIAL